ncbi:hypothetical protein HF324_27605 [Chitinophaga oryzae]|uniref:Uncharacterized protein n=1 Tax=Chitinophaga oryzae TaxID=2725414 RepID=A0AAE7D9H9_9BACT|nr:hypothetical protein [Chitinophaga oryzae]QJB34891.1 hypothetical protein HF329_27745 [Chitinophaga oryzae]QJB41402.1 hypothetical protein HF324_27605 [Chitinophaga oryzae]
MSMMLYMSAEAQITAIGINHVHLHTPISEIARKVRFLDSPYRKFFSAKPANNFYFLFMDQEEDSSNIVRFLIAQTGKAGTIIKLYAYLEANDLKRLIDQINTFSNKHTIATSSIGEQFGSFVHGWSTDAGTTILAGRSGIWDQTVGFVPTIVSIFYKSDLDEIDGTFVDTKK